MQHKDPYSLDVVGYHNWSWRERQYVHEDLMQLFNKHLIRRFDRMEKRPEGAESLEETERSLIRNELKLFAIKILKELEV